MITNYDENGDLLDEIQCEVCGGHLFVEQSESLYGEILCLDCYEEQLDWEQRKRDA